MLSQEPADRAASLLRRRTFGAVAGVLVCVAAGGAAQAQISAPSSLGGSSAGATAPALPPGKHFGGTLSVEALYHSNVVGGSDVAAAVKGLDEPDVTYTPNATITGVLPVGPGSVYVTGNIGYVFHQTNKVLDTPRSSVQAGMAGPVRLGPCALNLILGYTATPTDQSQLLLQTLKNVQSQTTYGASTTCSTGGSLGESLSVTHSSMNNSTKTGTLSSETTSASGGLAYRNKAIGELMLSGSYSKTDYGAPSVALTPAQQVLAVHGFELFSTGLQLSRAIGQRLSGTASLGLTVSKPEGGLQSKSSSGLTGSGSLAYRVNSRIATTLSYQRGQFASIQAGSSFSTQDDVALNVSYAIGARITTSVGYRVYRREEHVDDPTLFGTGPTGLPFSGTTRESGNGLTGSAGLRLGRNGQLTLNLGRTYRNTNLTVYNYTDYTAGLSLSERF